MIGENIPECLACDLKLENTGHALYTEAILYCESVKDYVSREIFQSIQNYTEEHIDYQETRFSLLEQLGLQNRLPTAMGPMGA